MTSMNLVLSVDTMITCSAILTMTLSEVSLKSQYAPIMYTLEYRASENSRLKMAATDTAYSLSAPHMC